VYDCIIYILYYILTNFYLRILHITAYLFIESQKLKPMWYVLFREKPLTVCS